MADWPDADELKQVLDVTSDNWDTTVDRVLAAAIAKVKLDVAGTEAAFDIAYPVPDDALAQAALRMAELISQRPDAAAGSVKDPTYNRLLFGHRRSFGIA